MKLPGETLDGDPTSVTVSKRVLNEILSGTGIDLEGFEGSVKDNLKPASSELQNKKIRIKTTVDSKLIRARNVVGVIPGKDTSEIIVVGGHYDHLGKHDGWIWNGADDNASGTVGVMTIAKACMATGEKPEKTIVFAAWTGEEKGLLGSKYFADNPYNDAKMILNLNYDMISRDNKDDTLGNKCSMNYTKKYKVLEELATKNNEDFSLGLDINFRPSERPRGGSDHSSFSAKDIPIFYFMAGFPPEYHQPGDHINLVNWDKMVRIIKIGYLNIWDLANSEW
jgi:Zn-dependent M28 family amino/carboxypeptidase